MKRCFVVIISAAVLPLLAGCSNKTDEAGASAVDPRLKIFAEQKHRQTEQLAARLHIAVPKEFRQFFQAAEAGNFRAVDQYDGDCRRADSPAASAAQPNMQTALFVPFQETLAAYQDFHLLDAPLLQKFADGILQSIPSDSIYFGGTDPGRFIITAVRDTAHAPNIIVLTQNVLADTRYMDYLRLVDGQRLTLPTTSDVQAAFQQYADGAKGRPPTPDEQITTDKEGRLLSVAGVSGVMGINGVLTKWIFDHNKDRHEFYVEESYPLDWMEPYLEPHGLILKLNKEPLKELVPAIVAQDRQFWETEVKDLLADPHFRANDEAQKIFAKLLSAIGGLYAYRHMTSEAEAAFKQALDLSPTGLEANFRLAQLYTDNRRFDEATAVLKKLDSQLDPKDAWNREHVAGAIGQIHGLKTKAETEKKTPAAAN
jgi:hypothetical protein